jgi:MFS family permease
VIAGTSDHGGRRPSFLICFSIYIVANIGLALQTNYVALLILRCVQAAGSSATIALSMAVVADIATSAERGSYTGYATAGILIGPAFGPTLGGIQASITFSGHQLTFSRGPGSISWLEIYILVLGYLRRNVIDIIWVILPRNLSECGWEWIHSGNRL